MKIYGTHSTVSKPDLNDVIYFNYRMFFCPKNTFKYSYLNDIKSIDASVKSEGIRMLATQVLIFAGLAVVGDKGEGRIRK